MLTAWTLAGDSWKSTYWSKERLLKYEGRVNCLTKEEWKIVEEKLKRLLDIVDLICDGYKVSLVLNRETQFKNAIMVYVNGTCKGEWCMTECEESRRFLRKISRSAYSQKQNNAYNKLSKRLQKEMKIDIKKTYSYYLPTWTSFNALKRHLIKENSSIELV